MTHNIRAYYIAISFLLFWYILYVNDNIDIDIDIDIDISYPIIGLSLVFAIYLFIIFFLSKKMIKTAFILIIMTSLPQIVAYRTHFDKYNLQCGASIEYDFYNKKIILSPIEIGYEISYLSNDIFLNLDQYFRVDFLHLILTVFCIYYLLKKTMKTS